MKFILTKEIGRLSRWLRILGFDTVYFASDNLGTLILEALREDRIIITRKKAKIDDLEKKTVVISSEKLERQLKEVVEKLNLKIAPEQLFSRCAMCNTILGEVEKAAVKEVVPPYVYKTQKLFRQCPGCKRIYWQGSHWGNVKKALKGIVS